MTGLRRAGENDAVVGTERDVDDALHVMQLSSTQGKGRPIVRRKASAELGRSVGLGAGTTRRAPLCSTPIPVRRTRPNLN